jgi:hypothetical protein
MDQEEIDKTRARFNVQGGASTFENENAKGTGGGGRVGVSKELESGDRISAGVSGSASKVKVNTPEGEKTFKQNKITGIDASYTKGDTTFGFSASRQPMMDGKIDKKINLTFRKEFAKGGMVVNEGVGASVKPHNVFDAKQTPKQKAKVAKVMGEFKDKGLHSGKGGPVVKNPKQAIAIALSEAKVKAKKK